MGSTVQQTMVPDNWNFNGSNPCLHHGGNYNQNQNHGPFYVNYNRTSNSNDNIGCRILAKPQANPPFGSQGPSPFLYRTVDRTALAEEKPTGHSLVHFGPGLALEHPRGAGTVVRLQGGKTSLMKRVRVYKEIISDENLRLAIREVNAGHRRNGNHSLNKKVIEIENNMDEYVEKLRAFIQGLVDGDEHMRPPLKRRRWDRNADSGKGKWRDINEPLLWPDQYVHHAVVQPMIPHIMRSMDRYCIASVPGRGNSYGVKALKKWMKNDVNGTKYCCECDIYHCFEELDPPYVIEALKRVFKDTETLWLCDAIMEYGVLIGAFFSAWFLHLTLQPLDLMIHQKQYGVSHYVRQMDNFTIFGSNKRKLRRLLEDIKKWLAEIGMKIKGNWQIFRVGFTPKVERAHQALPKKKQRHRRPRLPSALGYRFGHVYTILRKHNLFRLKQSLHLYYYRRDRNRVISFKRASGLISRLGQLRKCNHQQVLDRHYQPKTMFALKKVVRKECRRLQALYPPYQAA